MVIGCRLLGIAAAAVAPAVGAHAAPKKPTAHSHPASVAGPVGEALARARANYLRAKADKFGADAVSPGLDGQSFHIEVPLRDGDQTGESGISGFWTYKAGKLRVIYNAREYVGQIRLGHSNEHLAEIGGRMTSGRPWTGENAYGAQRSVKVESWQIDAVAFRSFPIPDAKSPYDDDRPSYLSPITLPPDQRGYWVEVPISGQAARSLAQNVRVVIEGKIAKLANGALTDCHEHYIGPTVDGPYEITELTCWVGAEVSRVAFIDKANGNVLKEWTTDANGAAEPDVH
jgi:hypothetical protein